LRPGTLQKACAFEHRASIGAQRMEEEDGPGPGLAGREPRADAPAGGGRDEGGVERLEIRRRRPDRRTHRERQHLAREQGRGAAREHDQRGEGGEASLRDDRADDQ
jgi:hypothetical protein